MPRWRRICIDVSDTDEVIGASVEFYSEVESERESVLVLASSEWTNYMAEDVLATALCQAWRQGSLPFPAYSLQEF